MQTLMPLSPELAQALLAVTTRDAWFHGREGSTARIAVEPTADGNLSRLSIAGVPIFEVAFEACGPRIRYGGATGYRSGMMQDEMQIACAALNVMFEACLSSYRAVYGVTATGTPWDGFSVVDAAADLELVVDRQIDRRDLLAALRAKGCPAQAAHLSVDTLRGLAQREGAGTHVAASFGTNQLSHASGWYWTDQNAGPPPVFEGPFDSERSALIAGMLVCAPQAIESGCVSDEPDLLAAARNLIGRLVAGGQPSQEILAEASVLFERMQACSPAP